MFYEGKMQMITPKVCHWTGILYSGGWFSTQMAYLTPQCLVNSRWTGPYIALFFLSSWALKPLFTTNYTCLFTQHSYITILFLLTLSATHTLWWMHQKQLGVQHLAQGHYNIWTGGARDRTTDIPIGGWPTPTPKPQPTASMHFSAV